jgi:hypothetical protein
VAEAFDPYHRWLGIPPRHQPPNHYRLLGLEPFEDDPEVIRDAAERQMAHVRTYQLSGHVALSQKILNELGAARACLLLLCLECVRMSKVTHRQSETSTWTTS